MATATGTSDVFRFLSIRPAQKSDQIQRRVLFFARNPLPPMAYELAGTLQQQGIDIDFEIKVHKILGASRD